MVAIPTPLAAFFIRLGNFVNQEILGIPTTVLWGIVFGNPADGSLPVARHPVQLYEGAAYLAIFGLLFYWWYTKADRLATGTFFGWCITLIFSSRFIIEFWKMPQGSSFGDYDFQMGQLLSLPFIIAGLLVLYFRKNDRISKAI